MFLVTNVKKNNFFFTMNIILIFLIYKFFKFKKIYLMELYNIVLII